MKNLSPKEAITILEGMRIDIPVPKAAVTQIKKNLALDMAINALNCSEIPNNSDTISRQAAIDALDKRFDDVPMELTTEILQLRRDLRERIPSAQPERRCVNCGRTVNNGGWYEDGRTRCPIEEHYALPKDGYCHLWEKRKDWEDDYVKRAEESEK